MASTRNDRFPGPRKRGGETNRGPSRSARSSQKGRGEQDTPDETDERGSFKSRVWKESRSFIFDFIGAMIVLLIIIGALFTYTGNWPPLVVVQSGSMQHSTETSSIGVIDTGDLVFVKKLSEEESPITYVEGVKKDHRTYDSYGDVIIFRPNGNETRTAIIHRSVIWVEFNSSTYNNQTRDGGGFDIPSMGLRNVMSSFRIALYEWPKRPTSSDEIVDVRSILNRFKALEMIPHSGYLTKGDDNDHVDQVSSFGGSEPAWIQPVKKEWIIGKSVGELPWFGIIKLKLENNGNGDIHPNSERNLWIALIVIVASPFVIDFGIHFIVSAVKKGRKEDEGSEKEEEEDTKRKRRPPGKKKDYIDLDKEESGRRGGRSPTTSRSAARRSNKVPPPPRRR